MALLTLADLRAQVEDDLARTDLTSQVVFAIGSAIRAYEGERFYFNETADQTLTLSVGVASVPWASLPRNFLTIDAIRFLMPGSTNVFSTMIKRSYDWIVEQRNIGITAPPSEYCVYNNALMFDCSDSVDNTLMLDGLLKLSTASSSNDTSVWFNDAVDLIRSRTRYEINVNILKDGEAAAGAATMEDRAYRRLKGITTNLKTTGRVVATYF